MPLSSDTRAHPGIRFSHAEEAFLGTQALGRLAYLDGDGAPIAVPVGFRVASDASGPLGIIVTGHRLRESAKFRRLQHDGRCAFVVDEGIGPGARGLLIRGRAHLVDAAGASSILIVADRVTTWGIESAPYDRKHRGSIHSAVDRDQNTRPTG